MSDVNKNNISIKKAQKEYNEYFDKRNVESNKKKLNKFQKGIIRLVAGEFALKNIMIGNSWLDYSPRNEFEKEQIKITGIHEHLVTLKMLTMRLNLKNILEIGTRTGESTLVLAKCAKELNGKLTSIDIDPCLTAKKRIKEKQLESNWEFIQNDSLNVTWNESIDHLFIDGTHTYEQVTSELEKFEPYVNDGGIITLHDIVHDLSVMDSVEDYIKDKSSLTFYKMLNNNGLGIVCKQL